MNNMLLQDFRHALNRWRDWAELAWFDFVLPYRRSIIGISWEPLQVIIWVVMLCALFGQTSSKDVGEYAKYVCAGLIMWSTITETVVGGANLFVSQSRLIRSMPVPLMGLVMRHVFLVFYRLVSRLVALLAVFAVTTQELSVAALRSALTLPVSMLVVLFTSLWLTSALAILGSRYRDLGPILQPTMRFLFFASPVFWIPQEGSLRQYAADINPAFWFIEIFRRPLLGELPELKCILPVITITILGSLLSMWAIRRYLKNVPRWI